MSGQVSSWFAGQVGRTRAAPERRFTLAGSDRSDRVLRWPALAYRGDAIDLGTTSLLLSNADGAFRFLVDCPLSLLTSCELALGFTHPVSGPERLSLFQGAPAHAAFAEDGQVVRLQLQGKTRRLTETALGTQVASEGLDFTASNHLPSDLAWCLVTSHAGFSALASTSNPDLDYAQWQAWREQDALRDVRVRAYYTGEKVYQALNTLATMASRGVAFEGDKLRFRDLFDAYGADNPPLPLEYRLGLELTLDPADITNHFFVEADLDPATGRFGTGHTGVHSGSVQLYGRKSGRFSSRATWFAQAYDPQFLVEDRLIAGSRPRARLKADLPLAGGALQSVGEVVTVTHSPFGYAEVPFRITGKTFDLERGQVTLELEQARRRPWQFQATVAASANLLVRTLSAVGSEDFLALEEAVLAGRLWRTGGGETFQPLDVYATALLLLNGSEALFGGPPTSGSDTAVLQRSSDAGSSAVVVASLAAGMTDVYDLFRVSDTVFLAATDSGGVLRSTDAGSSWSLTWTISPAYHVSRFFQPRSGTVWGGTAFVFLGPASGLHLWESTDEGLTWAPRHTVVPSGDYHAAAFHYLTDSECLLATRGEGTEARNLLRSRFSAPHSIGWTVVASGLSLEHMLRTASGHLLAGFDEWLAVDGGTVHRSFDEGSSWIEDGRIAKKGNVFLVDNGDGTIDGFISRTSLGQRTQRFRNHAPDLLF